MSAKELTLTGKNNDQALLAHPATLFGDWRKRFDNVRVLRLTTKDGATLVTVRLVKGAAPALEVDLDRASGDLVELRMQQLIDGTATMPKTMTFEGWKDFDGLRLPARILTEDLTNGRIMAETTKLETHVEF